MIEFLIVDTFTGSLARLTADEQKAAKTTAFDLQMNPARGTAEQWGRYWLSAGADPVAGPPICPKDQTSDGPHLMFYAVTG